MTLPLDQLFRYASMLALAGWVVLALAPFKRGAAVLVARLVAAVLCGGYAVLLAWSVWKGPGLPAGASFLTLDGISSLFTSRQALLAGWVHYLAFDLWAGAWETEDAARSRIPHWLLLACLTLTFLAGPVGLFLYLLVKAARRR